MSAPASAPVRRPSAVIGVALGCLPIVIAVVAAYGIVHCRIAPMSYGYCSGSEVGTALTIAVIALCGWGLELLAAIVCLLLRRFRPVGVGLLSMGILFLPLFIAAIYIAAFLTSGR